MNLANAYVKQRVKLWYVPVLFTFLSIILFRTILFVGYVPTESMEPTLKAGSYILGIRFVTDLEEGDIIVFQHDGQLLVKRIAGVPGDRIDLSKLSYMVTVPIPVWEEPVLTVPENAFFVLGDNTQNSIDSRYWEDKFVMRNDIVAKLFINKA